LPFSFDFHKRVVRPNPKTTQNLKRFGLKEFDPTNLSSSHFKHHCDTLGCEEVAEQHRNASTTMRNSKFAVSLLIARAKSLQLHHHTCHCVASSSSPTSTSLFRFLPSSIRNAKSVAATRLFSSYYSVEQFSDDEYECDFENQQVLLSLSVFFFIKFYCLRNMFRRFTCGYFNMFCLHGLN